MPFIEEILDCGSLSIVGLEKNTGKTECLNYILQRVPLEKLSIAISSIGIDGESLDQVTHSRKPEITLREGVLFSTSTTHYRKRRIVSELLHIDGEETSLGRVVTAKAKSRGEVILSGPVATASLKRWIELQKREFNVDLCIIDGALSRLSPASPALSEAMILTTGAAVSLTKSLLINRTLHVVRLIGLDKTEKTFSQELLEQESGVWLFDSTTGESWPLYHSAFAMEREEESLSTAAKRADTLYITGALTDRLLKQLTDDREFKGVEVVVKDFTKIFTTINNFNTFVRGGGVIKVLEKSRLVALCVNPLSPEGYRMDSDELCRELQERSGIPTYDIFNYKKEV